jgi:hypothetical protein
MGFYATVADAEAGNLDIGIDCDYCAEPIFSTAGAGAVITSDGSGEPLKFVCVRESCRALVAAETAAILEELHPVLRFIADKLDVCDGDAPDVVEPAPEVILEAAPPSTRELRRVLETLEGVVRRPGLPASLTLAAALESGLISDGYLADVWADEVLAW